MTEAHPRHELEQDADALGRVALIADQLAGIARNGLHLPAEGDEPAVDLEPDPEAADRVAGEAQILRNWEALCREAKVATPRGGDHARG